MSLESVTALRLWLALQQVPSRSPRACSQKIGFFCFRASSLASSSEDSQLICSLSLVTRRSTNLLGSLGGGFPATPHGARAAATSNAPIRILRIDGLLLPAAQFGVR